MIWCRLKTAAFSDSIHANIKTRLQCRDRKFSPRLHARHHLLSVRAIPRTRRCRACYHYKLENSNVVACSHAHDSYKQARAGAIIGKQKHSLTIGAELSWFVQQSPPKPGSVHQSLTTPILSRSSLNRARPSDFVSTSASCSSVLTCSTKILPFSTHSRMK